MYAIIFFQSENCGLLAANIPKRYSKLGTAGKTVPGIKSKVTTTENMPKGYFTEGTGMMADHCVSANCKVIMVI